MQIYTTTACPFMKSFEKNCEICFEAIVIHYKLEYTTIQSSVFAIQN